MTCTAFRVETEFWLGVMLTVALAAAGVALMGQFVARVPARLASTGYLIFGAGYLAICIGPGWDEHIMPNLVTTHFIDAHHANIQYCPSQTGERVWTWGSSNPEYASGRVKGDVTERDVRFDVVHDNGWSTSYNSTQLRALSLASERRLWHATISLWTGFVGGPSARACFRRHDESVGS